MYTLSSSRHLHAPARANSALAWGHGRPAPGALPGGPARPAARLSRGAKVPGDQPLTFGEITLTPAGIHRKNVTFPWGEIQVKDEDRSGALGIGKRGAGVIANLTGDMFLVFPKEVRNFDVLRGLVRQRVLPPGSA
jgi:hypothetical protein